MSPAFVVTFPLRRLCPTTVCDLALGRAIYLRSQNQLCSCRVLTHETTWKRVVSYGNRCHRGNIYRLFLSHRVIPDLRLKFFSTRSSPSCPLRRPHKYSTNSMLHFSHVPLNLTIALFEVVLSCFRVSSKSLVPSHGVHKASPRIFSPIASVHAPPLVRRVRLSCRWIFLLCPLFITPLSIAPPLLPPRPYSPRTPSTP